MRFFSDRKPASPLDGSPASSRRRRLLGSAALSAFAATQARAATASGTPAQLLEPLDVPPWTRTPGSPILTHPYGLPSSFESHVVRRAAKQWPMPGSGNVQTGAQVFAQKCAACHGAHGEGLIGDPLVGGSGTLRSAAPRRTVGSYWPYATTLFDYIRRAMPYNAPQSLSADEVYAVSAWILNRNGIVPDDARMDSHTLAAVRMLNRDGFLPDPRPGKL